MTTEIERALTRELQDVADQVRVPPLPVLPTGDQPRSRAARLWQPLLVAALVALVVGMTALLLSQRGGDEPPPTPSPSPSASITPSPTPTPTHGTVAATPPTVPFIFDQRLYVDGVQVPGTWQHVESRGGTWLAQQVDGSWWWGTPDEDAGRIEAQLEQPPVLSPNGVYIAFLDVSSGRAVPTGFDTFPAGEGLGSPHQEGSTEPLDLPRTEDGVPLRVRAVTDDGMVIVQGTRTSLLWRPLSTDEPNVVDLNDTAPDHVILQGTAAGLVVVDGVNGAADAASTQPYLADISPDGRLTRREGTLPTYDDLDVSPSGSWLLWSPPGTLGGEVSAVSTLRARPVTSGDEVVLTAPKGWGFANNRWTWEDDETVVSVLLPLVEDEQTEPRMVRCSVTLGACRGFAWTAPVEAQDSYSAQETLDAVVQAVVADDRTLLLDQSVVSRRNWDLLLRFADGGDGQATGCRDNGSGTQDCEIAFEADRAHDYYAILAPADNAYGWEITYVSVADG